MKTAPYCARMLRIEWAFDSSIETRKWRNQSNMHMISNFGEMTAIPGKISGVSFY
jgi:hypothetical protein